MIVTRFPPSPTGYLHIGGARTALFSWLYARKHGGRFVLRVEDTDRERSTQEAVQIILDSMDWLQLDYDSGPFYQTQRMDRYREVIQQLLEQDQAYHCYCSREEIEQMREAARARGDKPRYDGRCRHRQEPPAGIEPVVRFKNPLDGDVVIEDLIKGNIVISNRELDDLIIARSDGTPTYNLTVVVDDVDMEITHVIRGDDHVNNTPRQINILKALGAKLPQYAHVPMILGEDGKRLSKRHGAVGVLQYRDEGYLPDALLNYLVRLGWSHGDQEVFSRQQMIELFEIDQVHSSAAVFNPDKLLWLNYEYIKAIPLDQLMELSHPFFEKVGIDLDNHPHAAEAVRVNQERSKTLVELVERSRFFFEEIDSYDEKATKKHFKDSALDALNTVRDQLVFIEEGSWDKEHSHTAVHKASEILDIKLGKVAQPIRVAVTGTAVSPPIDETLAILGKEKTLQRIEAAIEYIKKRP